MHSLMCPRGQPGLQTSAARLAAGFSGPSLSAGAGVACGSVVGALPPRQSLPNHVRRDTRGHSSLRQDTAVAYGLKLDPTCICSAHKSNIFKWLKKEKNQKSNILWYMKNTWTSNLGVRDVLLECSRSHSSVCGCSQATRDSSCERDPVACKPRYVLAGPPQKRCRAGSQRAWCSSVAECHGLRLLGTRVMRPQLNGTVTLRTSGNVRASPRWDWLDTAILRQGGRGLHIEIRDTFSKT